MFWIHYAFAQLFGDQGKFEDGRAHIEHAKSFAVNSTYNLGRAMGMQASILYEQGRLEEARSEVLRAIEIYEKLGSGGV